MAEAGAGGGAGEEEGVPLLLRLLSSHANTMNTANGREGGGRHCRKCSVHKRRLLTYNRDGGLHRDRRPRDAAHWSTRCSTTATTVQQSHILWLRGGDSVHGAQVAHDGGGGGRAKVAGGAKQESSLCLGAGDGVRWVEAQMEGAGDEGTGSTSVKQLPGTLIISQGRPAVANDPHRWLGGRRARRRCDDM